MDALFTVEMETSWSVYFLFKDGSKLTAYRNRNESQAKFKARAQASAWKRAGDIPPETREQDPRDTPIGTVTDASLKADVHGPPDGGHYVEAELGFERLFDAAEFIDDELRISVAIDCGVICVAVARDGKPTVMHIEEMEEDTHLRSGFNETVRALKCSEDDRVNWRDLSQSLEQKTVDLREERDELRQDEALALQRAELAWQEARDREDEAQAWRAAAMQGDPTLYGQALERIKAAKS